MADPVEVREVASLDEARAAADLIDRVWDERRVVTPALLRAMSTHGSPVLAAFAGGRMVGAQMGFLALAEDGLSLHSHVTGVEPGLQHAGVGLRLKVAQREWCLQRDIHLITWTVDPMIARNAYFNLEKLGARATRFHRDFYGPMGDAHNAGERTDRLEVRWELADPGVAAALEGRRDEPPGDAPFLLDAEDGAPAPGGGGGDRVLLRIPSDYPALRASDPGGARAWREAAGDAFEAAFASGYLATRFLREGIYVLERA